jgi:diguanylate cyclase (GGDEF)-like protein
MDRPHGAGAAGHRLESLGTNGDAEPGAQWGFGLIVRDLARALGAEIAVLAVSDQARENVEVLAAWGATTSTDGLPTSLLADGFVGRALAFERAAVEPIPEAVPGIGVTTAGPRFTHFVAAPVRTPHGRAGTLCAALASDPSDPLDSTLWRVESYARLASLCLVDADALDGLLSGGRDDGLTGCLTQSAFLVELTRELGRAARHGLQVSCCFIDLDRFKRVNDRYGHLHGSRVLADIASLLRAGIRSEDTLARYGGDEFVLLLPDTDEAAAAELAGRLRAQIAATMTNLPRDPIDVSIGVAQWLPGSPSGALLEAADQALLAAKTIGGGVVISASSLAAPVVLEVSPSPTDLADGEPIGPAALQLSVGEVLAVVEYFEPSGGASIELTAWELSVDLPLVAAAWSRAIREGFLEPAGTDEASGEEMWRLSDRGRSRASLAHLR